MDGNAWAIAAPRSFGIRRAAESGSSLLPNKPDLDPLNSNAIASSQADINTTFKELMQRAAIAAAE
jgi:hypothetical protein